MCPCAEAWSVFTFVWPDCRVCAHRCSAPRRKLSVSLVTWATGIRRADRRSESSSELTGTCTQQHSTPVCAKPTTPAWMPWWLPRPRLARSMCTLAKRCGYQAWPLLRMACLHGARVLLPCAHMTLSHLCIICVHGFRPHNTLACDTQGAQWRRMCSMRGCLRQGLIIGFAA